MDARVALLHLWAVLVLLTAELKGIDDAEVYTNTWAVQIVGGPEEADRIAREHGFFNLGHVFGDYYHFRHHAVEKRALSGHRGMHIRLQKEPQVLWMEQQVVRKRKRRDVYEDPTDPDFPKQWYLTTPTHQDLNTKVAWAQGYTGRGVVVTILDDGIEKDHPDLINNYDPEASYDVNDGDADPQPRYTQRNENRHGTRCAGEVAAAANNGVCGVGVAYNAKIGGVRMLDGEVTDMVEAHSLSLNPQHIHIYSASWGPEDDGKSLDGPAKLAKEAFLQGITKGRGELGSIFVWASGNGGREQDSCNCDGYTNSIYTLSISSTTQSGNVPWYSEPCSSTLASTFSSGNPGEKQIVTTDLRQKCTDSHTGTSASAPLAAGIIALTLEAKNFLRGFNNLLSSPSLLLECSPGFSLFLQGCVKLCPPGFTSGPQLLNLSLENWVDLSSIQACLPCNPACLTCSGPGPTDCLSCPPHSHLVLTSCLHQNQVQRKSPLAGGLQGDGAQPEEEIPAGVDMNSQEGEEPPGLSVTPSTQLPAVVAVLSCAFILAAFVGVFLLLQMRSGGASLGWRTKLPSMFSETRGVQVGFGFGFGRGREKKTRICYKGIPTVWGDEDMIAYESESDSEEVDGNGERTAFIKTQSSI
nr:PREDICTED: furin-like [Paralichthys olivaceus]